MSLPKDATHPSFEVFSESYVFDPRPHVPFRISARRYWTASGVPTSDVEGYGSAISETRQDFITPVFAHANGFHKEHWEPVIRRLFEHQRVGGCSFQIQDMWAVDAPNHGDAGVMNEEVLAWGYSTFLWEDYARSVHAFLAGLGTGVDIDFSKRNLVAVGHSMGAVAVMLSTTFFPLIKFSSMHLIEPVLLGSYAEGFGSHLIDSAANRRDVWESADDAYKVMKRRSTWQKWDDRTLRIYVEDGLRSLPTVDYPDQKGGVTLKCTRKQEAACFRDFRSPSIAYRHLPYVMKKTPVHITYGEIADFLPAEWHDDVLYNASGGVANFASVNSIPGAGHLMVQTHPDAVADVIWKSLLRTHSSGQVSNVSATLKKWAKL
ncbi:Alpha/beta hydrolase family-domain-containing protein [Chiua virens]|nr:Alpha/beta hydrolase family-domain-containing protein [Chiua virens]